MATLYETLVTVLKALGMIGLILTLLVEHLSRFLSDYASRSAATPVLA